MTTKIPRSSTSEPLQPFMASSVSVGKCHTRRSASRLVGRAKHDQIPTADSRRLTVDPKHARDALAAMPHHRGAETDGVDRLELGQAGRPATVMLRTGLVSPRDA